MKEISITLYAECASPDAAQAIAQSLLSALQAHGPKITKAPSPYWKIPEFYGFEISLNQASEAVFKALTASPENLWTHLGDEYDRSSVWNPGTNADYFLVPQARWAEVQFTVREA